MSRWLIATMTSVLFIALVVAVTGFEALLADVEIISQPDATPYLGPAMVVGGALVVFLATAVGARDGNPGVTGLVAAATVYLVMLGVGSVGYALLRGDATELVVFPAGYALGPFVVGSVVVALLSVVGGTATAKQQARAARAAADAGGQRGTTIAGDDQAGR
ncbi:MULTISPECIES: DUF6121 family protein [unclassified Curtobacterium]|uniref:DUF6121 family protein n=1 Tax=unclassified Curtobacterium TaxID=257496 RepID=UPI0008DDD430|nr:MULTISPECIES: DUF6121 family protein [unclassified Curtobacterium]OIH99421.1 hypothetical protein BIU92_00485 [Curtobacterium sp. MCBA15_003]OII11325.1 hypothetical protein BIU97_05285 [Curtobacterium sp. MCBA15_009]OII30748.1 hypothetical protein BIU94_08410 [Curtobacterium sp. MMLR14_006]